MELIFSLVVMFFMITLSVAAFFFAINLFILLLPIVFVICSIMIICYLFKAAKRAKNEEVIYREVNRIYKNEIEGDIIEITEEKIVTNKSDDFDDLS